MPAIAATIWTLIVAFLVVEEALRHRNFQEAVKRLLWGFFWPGLITFPMVVWVGIGYGWWAVILVGSAFALSFFVGRAVKLPSRQIPEIAWYSCYAGPGAYGIWVLLSEQANCFGWL